MLRRFSIAELQNAGVAIRPAEAVAIAQQLIRASRSSGTEARPPFGPPTPANVLLARDGSVTCAGCDATCAVSEMAILLEALLPPGTTDVPGSLRYTVARALLEVDAPPFDSLEELSRALARHERGDRADAIRAIRNRAAAPAVDRRRSDPAVADLRRQLRESDARVYDQQLALDALVAMTPSAPRAPRRLALAAGLFVGVSLVGAGELMHLKHRSQQATAATVGAADRADRADSADRANRDADTPVVQPVRAPAPAAAAPALERPVLKRTARPSAPPRVRPREQRSRFHWLRTKFAFRADPL